MKDVTNNLETIEPVYTPGKISFDFDAFDKAIQTAVSELSDEQLDNLEYDDIKKEFTRFNRLLTKLDDKRKDISKVYKNPLNEFEANFKTSKEPLEGLIDKLRAKRDEIDEHNRLLRVDHVRSVFEEKCELAGLDKDTFKDKYDGYSLKKCFIDKKMKLKKATEEEIDALVLAEYDRLEEYKANVGIIEEQALDYELPAEPYTRALQNFN